MPGKRLEEPGRFIEFAGDAYWKPVCSLEKFGDPISCHYLFVRDPKIDPAEDQPAVLLEWQRGTLEYGQPSSKNIQPEAGQPWLALRAAMLAGLPTAPTLDMLSFLAPQVGDTYERAPLHSEDNWFPCCGRGSTSRLRARRSSMPPQFCSTIECLADSGTAKNSPIPVRIYLLKTRRSERRTTMPWRMTCKLLAFGRRGPPDWAMSITLEACRRKF
jgi:hypothetical protein